MSDLIPVDALLLAINALREVAESRRMPSGDVIDQATAELHADASEVLAVFLADLAAHK